MSIQPTSDHFNRDMEYLAYLSQRDPNAKRDVKDFFKDIGLFFEHFGEGHTRSEQAATILNNAVKQIQSEGADEAVKKMHRLAAVLNQLHEQKIAINPRMEEAVNLCMDLALYGQFDKKTGRTVKNPETTAAALDMLNSLAGTETQPLTPDNDKATFALATVYEQVFKDIDRAAAWYRRAAIEGNRDAEKALERLADKHPNKSPVHYQLALLLERNGKVDQAIQQYARTVETDDQNTSARERLAAILHEHKNAKAGLALANLHERKGEWGHAIQNYAEAAKLGDQSALEKLKTIAKTHDDIYVRASAGQRVAEHLQSELGKLQQGGK
jgi:tetratricopeptide (TPR) repeat protein